MNRLIIFVVMLAMSITTFSQRLPLQTLQTDTPFVHDPVVAFEDGTYHLFATGLGIQHMTSTDLKLWTVRPEPLMTVIPQWAHDSVPGFTHHVWAPDVIRWHNRWWVAYSCSTFGRNGSAIGLLSSHSLTQPLWNDEGCIVTSREGRDNWNAIDPCFVIDDNDRPWLFWGSFWDGIQLAPLDSTMHIQQGIVPRTIARRYNLDDKGRLADLPENPNPPKNPTSDYAGPNAIEAPFVFKHDGWYYLFVSWDYCCQGSKSNYRVAVGRSRSVEGPYLDRNGKDMRLGGGTLFFEGDKVNYDATGHCSVYHFGNEDLFFCHGYSVPLKGASVLVKRRISWTADGWPTITY